MTFPPGYRIGHATDAARRTGCTVILPPPGTIAAVDVRGGAPGTRETGLFTQLRAVPAPITTFAVEHSTN